MNITVVPPYEELFDGPRPQIEEILVDIPSKATIITCSYINHKLLREGIFIEENHRSILKVLLNRVDPELKSRFTQGYLNFYKKHNGKVLMFSTWYSCELITWELANFRSGDIQDTTPEHHIKVLQAYVLLSSLLHERNTKTVKELDHNIFSYQRATWPIGLMQFEFINVINPAVQLVISALFLRHFLNSKEYCCYVEEFFQSKGLASVEDYVAKLFNLIKASVDTPFIKLPPEFLSFATSMTVDPPIDSQEIGLTDFTYIKDKPLLHFKDVTWCTLNKNYLYLKIYYGLTFSFYSDTDIRRCFKSFPDYRNYIATQVSERKIFLRLMNYIFGNREYSVKVTDEGSRESMVDYYNRDNNRIMLLEFKDNIMSSDVSTSMNYDKIREDIDHKFVRSKRGRPKGVYQITKVIERIASGTFKEDPDLTTKKKIRNLHIFPVIVHSWFSYCMPGVNDYLNERYWQILDNKGVQEKVSKLHDLVLIDLDTLLNNAEYIKSRGLDNILKSYNQSKKNYKKKAVRNRDFEMMGKAMTSIRFSKLWHEGDQDYQLRGIDFLKIFDDSLDD